MVTHLTIHDLQAFNRILAVLDWKKVYIDMYGNFFQIFDTSCIDYILSNVQVNVLPSLTI